MTTPRGMLDAPLLQLSAVDTCSARDLLTHLLALGTTGSGKSSGTLQYAIKAVFKAGFGALVCTAKPEDAETITAYCKQTGRIDSLINWDGNGGFNALSYELARTGNINSVIDVLMHMIEIVRTSGVSPGRIGDEFWTSSLQLVLRHSVPVVYAACGTVHLDDLLAFIRSAPTSPEQMKDPEWQRESAFCCMFLQASARLARGPISGFDDGVGEQAVGFWRDDFARLDAKTAGNIRITLITALSRFQQGLLKKLFCESTEIVPELLFHGVILLMNFSVQTHGEDGAIAQKIMKFMVQRACLARGGMDERQRGRPIAIVADECHNFLHWDAEFLAQCRSSLVSVIFATQSLPTLYAKIGGDHPHDRAHHLVSNFNNLVLHSSACPETNDWFARKLGREKKFRGTYNESEGTNSSFGMNMGEGTNSGANSGSGSNFSYSHNGTQGSWSAGGSSNRGRSQGASDNWGRNQGSGANSGMSWGYSEQMDHMVEPAAFGRLLKTGGPANGNIVSAFWYAAGRTFAASGGNALLVEFRQ